ncbi:PD40 domain-containing protein [Aquimarina algicola]|uniref:Uncharacterized protein n=1 Tax=Aquimarina algicola TaxID=2589995 RepID=A0A504J2X7_9FLAO|nr:PD40 domain-containing protein [Aquimarina algicola]TPN84804.1 hypothetical protein FHK87_17910 [Aquimarina algicola]
MVFIKNFGALLFLFFWGTIISQEKQLQRANQAFEEHGHSKARNIYKKILRKGYHDKELYEKIGDSYYFDGKLEKAAHWYEELVKRHPSQIKYEHLKRYAHCLKHIGSYIDQDVTLQKLFINKIQNLDNDLASIVPVNYLQSENLSMRFVVNALSINSKYSEYSPSFYNNELVFASSRSSKSFSSVVNDWNNQPFLDLYYTTKGQKKITRLKGDINTKFHESSAVFSKDGKTVYFTRNNYSKGKLKKSTGGTTLLKIYKGEYSKGKWINIEELPFNSNEYSIAHPALSPDGRLLYFASDMPGSLGESDLYVCSINEDGSFGKPKNLGSSINTSGRETFPYISDKGNLFFASDGHKGLGGLDIFMATQNDTGNFDIYNLGEPINSNKDDFTFIIDESNHRGYFASNRKGGMGDDDIYGFKQIISFPDQKLRSKPVKKLERIFRLQPVKVETTSL